MDRQKVNWGWNDLILLIIALAPLVASFILYDRLPAQMAVHFGVDNVPNGFQSKGSSILLFGLLGMGIPFLMKVLPAIDPRRDNYAKFGRVFELVRYAITLLMSAIFGIVLLYNMGYHVNIQRMTLILIGLLFLVLGNYLGKFRANFFMGIKTPWTLANEEVWRKTHRLAGPLFMLAGVVSLVSAFLPGNWAVFMLIFAAIFAGFVPIFYSYVIFRKIEKE